MQLSKKQKGILYSSCFIILALVITFGAAKTFMILPITKPNLRFGKCGNTG